jgi:hypothetical protein
VLADQSPNAAGDGRVAGGDQIGWVPRCTHGGLTKKAARYRSGAADFSSGYATMVLHNVGEGNAGDIGRWTLDTG